ncbi:bifunctional 2-hydroxyhepta-2,4-diene-1,7-dioate isomerase/cyclase/dehydrase domain protein [Mycobacterium kansasii]|uniref:Bifunctional 2-hydroxyhepta-2,4-diene-1,7-dioate isomerase/cyclase/dehydrase domain protein n=1 Tax=Mycobacterium kansasii TaxID=1768 RepID=A0A1V3XIJ7_MYCKA|nr:bifunctional 2-hydroxyhepta-2,4-diene-1,7-dioate isomerase/cyclase/dehydrase domain protein [Mycobacterium kansasii]
MKWVTYRSDDGERAGVLSGDTIYALPPGSALLDLLGGAPTAAHGRRGRVAGTGCRRRSRRRVADGAHPAPAVDP